MEALKLLETMESSLEDSAEFWDDIGAHVCIPAASLRERRISSGPFRSIRGSNMAGLILGSPRRFGIRIVRRRSTI